MNKIILTQKQIKDLAKIAKCFKDVKAFTVEETRDSGIGPAVHVWFEAQGESKMDITDYKTW